MKKGDTFTYKTYRPISVMSAAGWLAVYWDFDGEGPVKCEATVFDFMCATEVTEFTNEKTGDWSSREIDRDSYNSICGFEYSDDGLFSCVEESSNFGGYIRIGEDPEAATAFLDHKFVLLIDDRGIASHDESENSVQKQSDCS